ncbi:MAG: PQQ-binding-like beta-propeller repeat protein [Planctomycetaceae bacterium]|nr:PQQ-binding-like beta-propeller repeat protein [Planctomycetaceae bacterium]
MRILLLLLVIGIFAETTWGAEHWKEFRGPEGNGVAVGSLPPLTWSESKNVAWIIPIHDRGWSSPVIWGDQIWVTSATSDGHQLFAICVDRKTGKIIHDLPIFEVEEPEPVPAENTYASPTSVIEEGRVYVHFGTYGTACIDTSSGSLLWKRRDLKCEHEAGPNSSPMIVGDLFIVNVDGRDVQYVIALDKFTGDTVWKTDRSVDFSKVPVHKRKAYSMPILISTETGQQLVSPGGQAIISYDPATGKELWKVLHRGWSIAPRPVFGHDLVFVVMDHDHPELWAIRPDGTGDVTESHIEWKFKKGVPARSSPLLVDDLLFFVDRKGILSCLEATSGELIWKHRLDGNYSSSPVFANNRIYFFNEEGAATVIKPARKFELLAENKLNNETMMASPAIAGDSFFLRTDEHLYRIDSETSK